MHPYHDAFIDLQATNYLIREDLYLDKSKQGRFWATWTIKVKILQSLDVYVN